MDWTVALGQFVEDHPVTSTRESREEDVTHHLKGIFNDMKTLERREEPSFSKIPRFYFKTPTPENQLAFRTRREARQRFLTRKGDMLLDDEELGILWNALSAHATPPFDGADRINYDGLCAVAAAMPVKCEKVFRPSVFSQFVQDRYGRIATRAFFGYVMRLESLHQTRITMSIYDSNSSGFLREPDLESYILELVPELPRLANLEEGFYPFYVCTAVRKFFFFLDPMRLGRIAIKDILTSNILQELFELREPNLAPELERTNWFSSQRAFSIYGEYLSLDKDHNGMLSRSELASFGNGSLTDAFLSRVFEECHTYEGEMDYKTFLDFVLAMENKNTPEAQQYFFRLLDVKKQGYLNVFTINYFFKDVHETMRRRGIPLMVDTADVKDEIFDMVKPVDPLHITLADLIRSSCGDTVVTILTDTQGFLGYDNRENAMVGDPAMGENNNGGADTPARAQSPALDAFDAGGANNGAGSVGLRPVDSYLE